MPAQVLVSAGVPVHEPLLRVPAPLPAATTVTVVGWGLVPVSVAAVVRVFVPVVLVPVVLVPVVLVRVPAVAGAAV